MRAQSGDWAEGEEVGDRGFHAAGNEAVNKLERKHEETERPFENAIMTLTSHGEFLTYAGVLLPGPNAGNGSVL